MTTRDDGADVSSSPPTPEQSNGPLTPASGSGGSGISGGVIAGIIIGAILGLALIIGLLWCVVFRRRRGSGEQQQAHVGYVDRHPNQPGLEVGDKTTGRPELEGEAKGFGRQVVSVPYQAPPVHELRSDADQQTSRYELPGAIGVAQARPTTQYSAPDYSTYPERAEHEYNPNPMPEHVAQDPELARLEREMQETRARMDRLQEMHALNVREQQLREQIELRRIGN